MHFSSAIWFSVLFALTGTTKGTIDCVYRGVDFGPCQSLDEINCPETGYLIRTTDGGTCPGDVDTPIKMTAS